MPRTSNCLHLVLPFFLNLFSMLVTHSIPPVTLTPSPWSPFLSFLFIHQPLLQFPSLSPLFLAALPPSLPASPTSPTSAWQQGSLSPFSKKKKKKKIRPVAAVVMVAVVIRNECAWVNVWVKQRYTRERRGRQTDRQTERDSLTPSLTQIGDCGWWAVTTGDAAGLACR